ncbi:MFS transporter [Nonomuraea sp. NPDC050556]|uniref:MFS transporter n=1 Tax=Nonomuraea sp. NPDC050556 TaxID=3364369 RepID=UPI0037ADCD6B
MTTPAPPAVFDESPAARKREQRGWYFYDWANSAFPTTVLTVFLGPYLTTIAESAACAKDFAGVANCTATFDTLVAQNPALGYVDVLGLSMRPSAFYPFVIGVAAAVQVVLMLIAGAIADHTGRKKQIMGTFAYIGAAATVGMWFVADGRYMLGGWLYIVASVSFACAFVVYNSFLPEIATPDERDRVSTTGWGFGYLGGFLLLLVNLGTYQFRAKLGISEGDAVRLALSSAGLWWAGFTIIPLVRLRNRHAVPRGRESTGRAVIGSFAQLGRTIKELFTRYPLTLLFLVTYLLYNDGVQTVISFSATYASQELGLSKDIQILAILMVQFVAFFGALLLGRLARSFGAKRVVLLSLVGWTAVVIVAYFLPKGSAVAFFALGFAIAIVMGGTQSLSRSLFSHVIPKGKEAEYYSLYEISDKGSTMLGSFTLSLALQATNSYRIAIVSLVVFFILGGVMLAMINLPKVIRAAGNEVPDKI